MGDKGECCWGGVLFSIVANSFPDVLKSFNYKTKTFYFVHCAKFKNNEY